nr:hypothetical protein [Tanacetum cinerariifolium]GEY93260.1 hypothetical protein [Tanacetum cinerariifolium]
MTTSSANNSVFRGFFEKQKLTGPYFIDWIKRDCWPHAHDYGTRDPTKFGNLHAYEMLLELKTLFAQQAEQELLQTTRDFHSCKQEEGQSVSSYVLKMKGYIDNLERLGHPVILGLGGLRESRKLKPVALSLYVGNGQREVVEAIGLFLFMNNMVYFSAIPKDGIFEFDLSNSYTNESSIYVVSNKRAKLNLDSALLWHCRLRHISKKRIEKLQHDGLLDSTDPGAFEKCVSCMSGKMAKKLYTHQVEIAKDLLGLIYTDVCGPFKIMSRQGASYFVTFTDDFSRASTPAELKRMQNVPYASVVGSIMYVVRCTPPDVAFAQNVTSRFQQNPGDLHWTTVKDILKYLRNTKDMFIVYEEAKYIAAFDASKEVVWVRKFISGLGVVPTIEEPISMYYDNTGSISIANESGITKGAIHFHAKVHYLREVIEYGDVKLEKVHTDDNLADPFTKVLAFPKHFEHTRNIEMLPASSLM